MLDLTKTSDLVKKAIGHELFLLEVLKDDLVNISALSRTLLPLIQKENPKATLESVSIAIKRYVEKEKKKTVSKAVREIIANSRLSSKNDVCHITFRRNDPIVKRISEISQSINWNDEEIFFVNQGPGEITIIIDKKNEHLLKDCKRYQIEQTKNLTIISVKETIDTALHRGIDVPGVYAYFMNQLARNSINVISVISTYSQITVAVKNKEFLQAYRTLQEAIDFFRK